MNTRRIAYLLRERAKLDVELAEAFEANETSLDGDYSSTSLPPGISSREHFATECRKRGIGIKHGRVWVVTKKDWHDARSAKKKRHLRVIAAPASSVQMADEDIEAAGARSTRRGS